MSGYFNPRPPRRGRRVHASDKLLLLSISIHVPREGGDNSAKESIKSAIISIHVPREGGDSRRPSQGRHEQHFNPHPPRRGRLHNPGNLSRSNLFQSTSPAKGATVRVDTMPMTPLNFNPRPPRRGRPSAILSMRPVSRISIHVPREGGDVKRGTCSSAGQNISIHVPREGGDVGSHVKHSRIKEFQSTSPAKGATAKMHSFTCGSLTNK